MQTFQSYYPINQNYNQPMQINPYMQRLDQYQQNLQPSMTQNQISMANQLPALGKIVESIDIVKATDIPMDGNTYYFPKADGTELFSKQWLPNGQTRILTFKPILEDEKVNSSTDDLKSLYGENKSILEGILDNLNTLNDKVDKITKVNSTTKAKKESVADE